MSESRRTTRRSPSGPALQPRDEGLCAHEPDHWYHANSGERLFSQMFSGWPTDEAIIAAAPPHARVCVRELSSRRGSVSTSRSRGK
jgi:hypothetical protein